MGPIVLEPVPQKASSESHEESGVPAAKIPRGEDVVVELPGAIFRLRRSGANGCWMGRRREFRNCQEFPGLPDKSEYTHVCRLCWPSGGEGEDSPVGRWGGATRPTRRAVRIPKETSDPDNLGSDKARLVGKFWIKPGPSPKGPICFPINGDCQGKRGSGEEEDPRREERTDMLPATVMSLTHRASYFYSGWLCIALSSAILSGHGY